MSPSRNDGRATRAPLHVSLRQLRLRLTAWYVGTFFAILVLLGMGTFTAITRRFDRDLDASLRDAWRELARVSSMRDRAGMPLFDSLGTMRIPDRTLLLLDTLGQPLSGGTVSPWLARLGREASRRPLHREHQEDERHLRGHAERLMLPSGRVVVGVAVADEVELEDRYAALIATLGAAAFAALVLVAAGGWMLARQTTEPVERAIVHMRRFMADAAHELRTPITVVRSRADVALQRPRTDVEYTQALGSIERESARLGRIVEDLLMLARADAGERPIERRRVFIDDVALDAAEAVRVIADRRSVRLEVEELEESAVDGDATLLRQLVVILLDNAVKFTEAGGVVRIGTRRDGQRHVLTVSDTGVGIPDEQLAHVFERFYRGEPSRTRVATDRGRSEGVGLGLSIARWIADEHKATIAIESRVGHGTRVSVTFPPATLAPATGILSSEQAQRASI